MRRRPKRSPSAPARSSRPANTRVYASTTHWSSATSASRSRTRVGSATLTMVLSMTIASRLAHRTPSAAHRLREPFMTRSGGAGGEQHGEDSRRGGDDQGAAGTEDGPLRVDVDADRRGDRPAERPQRTQRRRPEVCDAPAQDECLGGPDRKAADRALYHEVGELGAVVDGCRPERESHGQTGCGRGDPAAGRRTVRAHPPRLDGAEDDAGDGAGEQGRGQRVDRAGDERCQGSAEGEADERGQPAQRAPLPRRRLVAGGHDVTAAALVEVCDAVTRRSWTTMTTASAISQPLQST